MKNKIEKYLSEQREDKYYEVRPGIFHASESSYCSRFIYFERVARIEDSLEQKKYFLLGNIFHKFFEENLLTDYTCESEVEYDAGDFKIVGRIDAYNENEVIDLKTCKDANYVYVPKEDNIIQLNIYMKALEIPKGRLIYIGKNDVSIREFEIEYNEGLFQETLSKLRFIQDKLNKGAKPEEINVEPNSQCFWCKYRRKCFPVQRK